MQRLHGKVAEFDEQAGYGTVTDSEGSDWFFHCTAIADGTRSIETGVAVDFELVAGRLGRWEAADLSPST